MDRFRYGARDVRTETIRGETRTIVIRPDGTQIITVVGNDGRLLRRIRRDDRGREIIIIDNSYRDPRAIGGFYVDLPPPMIRIPRDRTYQSLNTHGLYPAGEGAGYAGGILSAGVDGIRIAEAVALSIAGGKS